MLFAKLPVPEEGEEEEKKDKEKEDSKMFFSICVPIRKSENVFPMKKCPLDDCDSNAEYNDCKNGMDVTKMTVK